MDVNAFYKCKIIEILIEQEPSDNMCVHVSVYRTQWIDVCAFMCGKNSDSNNKTDKTEQNRTENDNKTTSWLKLSSHIHTFSTNQTITSKD